MAEAEQAIHWARARRYQDETARFRDPTARFRTSLGFLHLQQNSLPEATAEFEVAMAAEPSHFLNWWGKAGVLKAMGKIRDARHFARVALGLAPDDLRPPLGNEIRTFIAECSEILRRSQVRSGQDSRDDREPCQEQ